MAEVINLNRFKKAAAKAAGQRRAEENRIRFGRTKVEKRQDETARLREVKDLDGKKQD